MRRGLRSLRPRGPRESRVSCGQPGGGAGRMGPRHRHRHGRRHGLPCRWVPLDERPLGGSPTPWSTKLGSRYRRMTRLLLHPGRLRARARWVLRTGAATPWRALGVPSFRSRTPGTSASTPCRLRASSAQIVNSIGANTGLHADFGSGMGGRADRDPGHGCRAKAAEAAWPSSTPTSPTPAPIPFRATSRSRAAAPSSDRHALIVGRSSCRLYQLYAHYPRLRLASANSGAIWSLRSTGCARQAGPPPTPPGSMLPGSRATTRSQWGDRPCASLHGRADATGLRLPGTPLRKCFDRSEHRCRWALGSG